MVRPEEVRPDSWKKIQDLAEANTKILAMSTLTTEGVDKVKDVACETLLEYRVEKKLKSKISSQVVSRVHVAMPAPRDEKERPPYIPTSVVSQDPMKINLSKEERALRDMKLAEEEEKARTEMWERGEVPDMNSTLWRERWKLERPSWRFDVIPEILDGKNIFDYVDPDIEQMLDELEREESARVQDLEDEEAMQSSESEIDEEAMELINKIREKKKLLVLSNRNGIDFDMEQHQENVPRVSRRKSLGDLESHLKDRGFTEEQVAESIDKVRDRSRTRSQSAPRSARKRSRSASAVRNEEENLPEKKKLKRAISRERSVSKTPKPGAGYKNVQNVVAAERIYKKIMVGRGKLAKKGEADRSIPNLRPKHLITGKRGVGKTDRR